MEVLKRRQFARWQRNQNLPDALLCAAVREIERGLVDAELGKLLVKKRLARPGSGKRDGHRALVAVRRGVRHVFVHGFSKNQQSNITPEEKRALQFAGQIFLELSGDALLAALRTGVLMEVECEKQAH